MRYYTYHIKMPDLRGGMPGFLSKSKPNIVDGVAHLLVKDDRELSEPEIAKLFQQMSMGFMGSSLIKLGIARPFSNEEFEAMPKDKKDSLLKNGNLLVEVPHFSSHLNPFR
jgi:hypothetical protein